VVDQKCLLELDPYAKPQLVAEYPQLV